MHHPHPRIAALATALPATSLSQAALYERIYRQAFAGSGRAARLFHGVGVQRRHGVFLPASADELQGLSTARRMQLWKAGAMELGRRCIGTVLERLPRDALGSFVMASCTGYDTPSPDILLAREFELPRGLRRTFIGHVGCHAAFTAIKVGLDALAARPDQAALIHCTEISSAHMRTCEAGTDQIVTQALFGDASAALVLSADASHGGPELLQAHTESLPEHHDQLGWTILDDGFRMSLSPQLPSTIAHAVPGFVERLLAPWQMRPGDVAHWGIHPGGPKIVELVARALLLPAGRADSSLGVLADHGNCSSATILLILERMLKVERPRPGSFGVLLGFGPGLTLEGLLLRF